MAKESNNEEEVFGEDFNLLDDGMLEIFEGNSAFSQESFSAKADEDEVTNIDNQESASAISDDEEEDVVDATDNEDTDKTVEDTNSDSDQNSSSPLIPYARYLKEEGILPNFDIDKFDGSIDSLREGMSTEINSEVDNYKNSLPDKIKHLINNYEEGVSLESILKIDSARTAYSSINKESISDNEDLQKGLVRDYLLSTTRFSEEKIAKEISRLVDLGELEDEANLALPELMAMQDDAEKNELAAVKEQKAKDEQSRLDELESLRSTLETSDELIPGIKLNNTIRQKIFKNLTTPVAYADNGQPLNKLGNYRAKNPMKTEMLLNYIFEATNEFKDWSMFNKSAKREVISDIEKAARTMDMNSLSGKRSNNTKFNNKSLLDAMEAFQ